jgi:hypothetical protein
MLQVLVAISQKFCCQKEAWAMQKLFTKKEKKKRRREKNRQVSEISIEKREVNNIAHVFLQRYFQVSKERYVFKEHNKIKLATIYVHHTSTHMHILI